MPPAQLRRAHPAFEYTETGLVTSGNPSFEEWQEEVALLQREYRAAMWRIGDAFLAGEARFGERYAQAVEPYSADTIQRAMRVCRVFPPARRRTCGFSFHYATLLWPEDEQDKILDLAVTNEWTRETFRQVVRARNAEAKRLATGPVANDQRPSSSGPAPLLRLAPPASETDNGPPLLTTAELVDLYPVDPETPAQLSADDAAALLLALARGDGVSSEIGAALLILLAERDRLTRIREAAAQAAQLGIITPLLRMALAAV